MLTSVVNMMYRQGVCRLAKVEMAGPREEQTFINNYNNIRQHEKLLIMSLYHTEIT